MKLMAEKGRRKSGRGWGELALQAWGLRRRSMPN
jgi:hypothetical protein